MPPLLVSGLILIFEKFVEPIAIDMLPTVASKLGSLSKSAAVNDVLSVFEGAIGKVADEKIIALKGHISEMLAQANVDAVEAASASMFVAGARPFLFWAVGINLAIHLTIWNLIDLTNSLLGTHLVQIGQIDSITLSVLSALLGVGIISRTAEKLSGVERNSMDD